MKVYCQNCKNYHWCERGEVCLVKGIEEDNYLKRSQVGFDPRIKNNHNNCSNFSPTKLYRLLRWIKNETPCTV